MCELIYHLCKSTTMACRTFIAHLIPLLLWMEWVLAAQEYNIDAIGEDRAALEIAILAVFQQDYNIAPLAPVFRVFPLSKTNLYQGRAKKGVAVDRQIFPYNQAYSTITLDENLYTDGLVDGSIDCRSRLTITNRLCRYFQDFAPMIDDQILICHVLLLNRLALMGTHLKDDEQRMRFYRGDMYPIDLIKGNDGGDDQQQANTHHLTGAQITNIFYQVNIAKSYPIKEQLLLLWSEILAIVEIRYPILKEALQESLFRRSKILLYPTAILTLGQSNYN